jgi:hypothetical protein
MLLYIALYPVGIISSILTGKYVFKSKREKTLILKNMFLPTYNLVPLTISVIDPVKKLVRKINKNIAKKIISSKGCFLDWYFD